MYDLLIYSLSGSFSEDTDEESGKDWDELEEEARRGKKTHTMVLCYWHYELLLAGN